MTEARKIFPDFMAFAALGAMESGRQHARLDVRVGSRFQGSMPAADAIGLTESDEPGPRLLRSMFMFGYLEVLKEGDLFTDAETGVVVEFRRIKHRGPQS